MVFKKKIKVGPRMTCFASGSSPAGHAGFIAVPVAVVVAKHVVARTAEFCASGVVVVWLALDADAVS